MKKDGRSTRRGRILGHPYITAASVLILGITATAMLFWVDLISEKQRINFLHMDAVMDAQIKTASFHLWFEEAISEDNIEATQKTFSHLDDAMQLSYALLCGGESEHGVPLPPFSDLGFRKLAEKVVSHLTRLKEVALRRSETPRTAGIGSSLDEEFDFVFNDFEETARALEVLAEKSMAGDHAKTRRLLFVIVLAWIAIVAASTAGLFNWERRRKRAEMAIETAYEAIEKRVEDRTSQLSSTNRQLLDQIAERIRAENQLKRSSEQLRSLAAHLQSVREEERTWVAREIHDQLGQTLTGLNMDLVWLKRGLSKEGVLAGPGLIETINSMSNNIEGAIRLVSEISIELRPGVLDDLGFIAAIEWQSDRFRKRTGVRCHLTLPDEGFQLDRDRSTALFRIFQEILTNVARHANATEVDISLTNDSGMLMLEVNDNGRGITDSEISDPRAFGILGMRERAAALAGDLHVEGVHGQGTNVVVRIPLAVHNGSEEKSSVKGPSGG